MTDSRTLIERKRSVELYLEIGTNKAGAPLSGEEVAKAKQLIANMDRVIKMFQFVESLEETDKDD